LPLTAAATLVALLLAVAAAAQLQEREDGHRPLRGNSGGAQPSPAQPERFSGYAEAPDYTVRSRQDELAHYPCEACHAHLPVNETPRKLAAPHPAGLDHGGSRLWCLDCHAPDKRNQLVTLRGERLGFDEADRVCAQCHYQPHRDWVFGAHGKRVANWRGERELYSCAHCHNPHAPALAPRPPEPPPPVRAGLERSAPTDHDDGAPAAGAGEPWHGE
jgi:hypothetical protein